MIKIPIKVFKKTDKTLKEISGDLAKEKRRKAKAIKGGKGSYSLAYE